jgi:DNA-binding HxlR family transcriptional regulator
MRTYGQDCPIARASELLGERWSIIILRNILVGCQTFNEIADGAPGLSRGLLSKRLRELQRAGLIDIRPKPNGPGSTYEPTQAGRELAEVMLALQHWGRKWAELKPDDARVKANAQESVGLVDAISRDELRDQAAHGGLEASAVP